MKKHILIALMLSSGSVFAAEHKEDIKFLKMGSFISKDACMEKHFRSVSSLVNSKAKSVKTVDDEQMLESLSQGAKVIEYQNKTQFIYHSLEDANKNFYVVEAKKGGKRNLYEIVSKNLNPINECIVFIPEMPKVEEQNKQAVEPATK